MDYIASPCALYSSFSTHFFIQLLCHPFLSMATTVGFLRLAAASKSPMAYKICTRLDFHSTFYSKEGRNCDKMGGGIYEHFIFTCTFICISIILICSLFLFLYTNKHPRQHFIHYDIQNLK